MSGQDRSRKCIEYIRKKVEGIRADPQWKDIIAEAHEWRKKSGTGSGTLPTALKKKVGEMAWHCCPSYTSQALVISYHNVKEAQDSVKDPRISVPPPGSGTGQANALNDPEFMDLVKRIEAHKETKGRKTPIPFDLKKEAYMFTLKHPVSWVAKYTKLNYHECRDAKLRLEAARRRAIVTKERPASFTTATAQPGPQEVVLPPPVQQLEVTATPPTAKAPLLASFSVGKLVAEFYDGGNREEAKKLLGDFLEGIKGILLTK